MRDISRPACRRMLTAVMLVVGLGRPVWSQATADQRRAHAQASQSQLASKLLHGDETERSKAIEIAQHLKPANVSDELRAALFAAPATENGVHADRERAARRGEQLRALYDPEARLKAVRAVVPFHDSRAIPALAGALGTGGLAWCALADFGDQAAPAVLRVVRSPESNTSEVTDGLRALRLMIEHAPPSSGSRGQIRAAVRDLLTGPQEITKLWQAIDLGVALGDAELRQFGALDRE